MVEWNPITGFMGQKLCVALAILFAGPAAMSAYAWYVTESNWAGLLFAVLLFGVITLVAGVLDVSRCKRRKSPYLSHLVFSIAAAFFGILFAFRLDDGIFSVVALLSGIGGAAVFMSFSVLSLKGVDVYGYNWNAVFGSLVLLIFSLLNGARIYDGEGQVSKFFYFVIPISFAVVAVFGLWFRRLSRKREIKYGRSWTSLTKEQPVENVVQ